MIKITGKKKNYELIEYISNVNIQYTQVLMELNENGVMDAAYTYGVSRLTEDQFTRERNIHTAMEFIRQDFHGNLRKMKHQKIVIRLLLSL